MRYLQISLFSLNLLLVLAVGLVIAELFTASFGLLTSGGIIVLIIGSLMLFKGGTLFINPALIAVVAVFIAAFLVFVISKVVGAHRRQTPTGREEIPISALPKTSLGRWSVGLAIAFILFFFLMVDLTGWTFGPGFNPVLAVVLKIILAGMPGAVLVTGLISMIKRKERSVFVLVSMALGLWFLIVAVWHLAGGD